MSFLVSKKGTFIYYMCYSYINLVAKLQILFDIYKKFSKKKYFSVILYYFLTRIAIICVQINNTGHSMADFK